MTRVDHETLLALAEMSQEAYGAGALRLGGGVEVLCGVRRLIGGERAVLAIRGSDWGGGLPIDWARNLSVGMARLRGAPGQSVANTLGVMRAHAGFLEAAVRVLRWLRGPAVSDTGRGGNGTNGGHAPGGATPVVPPLLALAYQQGTLVVCGHSLGGAIAQLVALLAPRGALGAASFGAPAVGNAALALALKPRVTRVEYRRDPVPGALDRLGYVRGGGLVTLGPSASTAWIEDALRLRAARQALADHAIGAYIAALLETTEASTHEGGQP
ncbi:MAG: lipase family protein [Phycisphaerae bacterium]|nr:lipase family protein [Phycisphaerae bacterium]MCZ2398608.1 lipase family protein [Phycisphaerae bacterium]